MEKYTYTKKVAFLLWKAVSHPKLRKAYIYAVLIWFTSTVALNGLAYMGRGAEWLIAEVPVIPSVYAELDDLPDEEMPYHDLDPSMVDESTYPDPTTLVIHDTDVSMVEHPRQLDIVDKSHQNRGYQKSHYSGKYIAYHYFIGSDGTVVQIRSEGERTEHTACGLSLNKCVGDQMVNDNSLAIALAGALDREQPTRAQIQSLKDLIKKLDKKYHFEKIIPHKAASPTACPGKYAMEALKGIWRGYEPPLTFNITRYYTPVPGQSRYFRDSYESDYKVNCSGDCLVTASGYRLKEEDAFKIAACPPEYKYGQKIDLEVYGVVICQDHGSAIKGNRIDLWAGYGEQGLKNLDIHTCPNATKDGCPLTGKLL